jgi:hypothetical protein
VGLSHQALDCQPRGGANKIFKAATEIWALRTLVLRRSFTGQARHLGRSAVVAAFHRSTFELARSTMSVARPFITAFSM